MPETLLRTKLFVPPLLPNLVSRPHLLERLGQVATLLGHESLDTTRIYTQPSERDLERAVRRAAGENPELQAQHAPK